jgi:hypothetical protein
MVLGGLLLPNAFGASSILSSYESVLVGKKNLRSLDRVFNRLLRMGSTGMS